MKILEKVDIQENKRLVFGLNMVAVILWILLLFPFAWLTVFLAGGQQQWDVPYTDLIGVMLGIIPLLAVHELIHGLFFKLFAPERPVRFGFKWSSMMAYATSPGSLYQRKQMAMIAGAPFVMLTALLTVGCALHLFSPVHYLFWVTFHACGCVGDFFYLYLLLIKYGKGEIRAEDTENGLIIYQV
ncbi:DUF3267 domain-containing protein [Streptococcus sp. DD13]|uniref:DUF3267 domain-containing protein n=1 Tax=Streptococcus sp. DD13 TaxID=1777881 RepID=UPI00079BA839|nr:DUF3267 domain-containing protein [Streptococcus sp. DD13]KXT79269.1 transcriptional regulator [Streptococcus sp. DD13]